MNKEEYHVLFGLLVVLASQRKEKENGFLINRRKVHKNR